MLVFDFTRFPLLATERLALRCHVMEDADDLWALRENDEVRKYLNRPRQSREEVQNLTRKILESIDQNDAVMWAIAFHDSDKLIGNIGFWRIGAEHHRAEIGYLLAPEYWNQGIMTEALVAVLNFGFQSMKLHSVEATINPANVPSERVLEKCGFVREAYFTEDYLFEGKFIDSAVYSLLEPWYRKSTAFQQWQSSLRG